MPQGVLGVLSDSGIVPVHADTDVAALTGALRACYAGGVRAFEFTDRVPGALELFRQLRAVASSEMPDLLLGAGTIRSVAAAAAFANAGAAFLVGPVLAEDVLAWSVSSRVPFVPGVATPTEAFRAHEAGATLVKLFPAGALGTGYLRSMLAPLPELAVMVTGGIKAQADEVRAWLAAGAAAIGLGSDLLPRGPLGPSEAAQVTRTCRELSETVKEWRAG